MADTDAGQHFATRTQVDKKSLTFFREAGRGKALVQINNQVRFSPGLVLLMGEEGSGRSRLLTQFVDGLKEKKTGVFCLLNRSIKNESHLYAALLDGFNILMSHDSLPAMQQAVHAFIESNAEINKPLVIALDDVQHCSLAMLEALVALQKRYPATSLILVGDQTLQKMLERLFGSRMQALPVELPALDSREIRQYLHWRLPFATSDLEMTNIVTLSRGNMALLEQEAKKREANHQLRTAEEVARAESEVSFGGWGIAAAVLLLAVGGFYVLRHQAAPESVPAELAAPTSAEATAEQPVWSTNEWLSRQETLLDHEQP